MAITPTYSTRKLRIWGMFSFFGKSVKQRNGNKYNGGWSPNRKELAERLYRWESLQGNRNETEQKRKHLKRRWKEKKKVWLGDSCLLYGEVAYRLGKKKRKKLGYVVSFNKFFFSLFFFLAGFHDVWRVWDVYMCESTMGRLSRATKKGYVVTMRWFRYHSRYQSRLHDIAWLNKCQR